jgi:hypothetical protein
VESDENTRHTQVLSAFFCNNCHYYFGFEIEISVNGENDERIAINFGIKKEAEEVFSGAKYTEE